MKKYNFNLDKLNADELMSLDEMLADIIVMNDELDDGEFASFVENFHEERYKEYCKNNLYVPQSAPDLNGDDAWMFAQRAVVNMELRRLDDEKIDNFFLCRGWSWFGDEKQEVWEKATA